MKTAIGLAILTLLAFQDVTRNGYVYEDRHTAQAIGATHQPLVIARRSVTAWSYYLTAQVSDTAQAQHLVNVALHVTNALLLGWIASLLGVRNSWLVSGLTLVHPLNTEAVVYVTARADLLMTTGVLVAVIAALQRSALGVVLGGLIALGAKEIGVVVVPLIALAHFRAEKSQLPKYVPQLLLAGVAALSLPIALDLNRGGQLSTWGWLQIQATGCWQMILLALWPLGQSIEHDVYLVHPLTQILAAVSWLALGPFALWHRRTVWGFGLAWLWLALLPRLVIQTPYSFLTEHQFYLAMGGLTLSAVAWLEQSQEQHVAVLA